MINWLYRVFIVFLLAVCSQAWAIPGLNKLDSVKAELITRTETVQPGTIFQVGFLLNHKPKWHTYWKATGDTGFPTSVEWQLPEGWVASDILWPVPKVFKIGPLINYGYEDQVLLPVNISVPREAKDGQSYTLKAKLSWLMCEEQCVPGSADLTLHIQVGSSATLSPYESLFARTNEQIPTQLEEFNTFLDPKQNLAVLSFSSKEEQLRDFYIFAEGERSILYAEPQKVTKTDDGYVIALKVDSLKVGETFSGLVVADEGPSKGGWAKSFSGLLAEGKYVPGAPVHAEATSSVSGWLAVGMAFLGGLILNLMPCVFPVLSLKIIGLVNNRGKSQKHLLVHGLAFTFGILLTMTALAGALALVKQSGAAVGWGFQLQSPWFVAALFVLFIAITVNLLGLFEFTLGTRISLGSSPSSSRFSVGNSFATGILAVVVASPCTAPFMGAALGYALTADFLWAFCVFIALGLGMALPWLLLTTFPVLTSWLPKPGNWMVRFRQIMAIPMFLTAMWLFWVLFQQVQGTTLNLFFISAIIMGFALCCFGKVQWGHTKFKVAAIVLALLSIGCYAGGTYLSQTQEPTTVAQHQADAWSEEAVEQAIAKGHPVFVDFTASWCVTCQANKLAVLDREAVQSAFKENNVVFLVADWTNRNDAITKALEKFGRSGVPLYLMYSPNGSVQVLPELLTIDTVIDAVKKSVNNN